MFSFSLFAPAFAADANPYMPKYKTPKHNGGGIPTDNTDADSEDSDDFYDEMIYEQYGSDQSPAFNNRENINPNESDYSYGSADSGG